jgi:hypothetical protein
MKSRNILIASVVVGLTGAAWFWTTQPKEIETSASVQKPSVPSTRIEAPSVQSPAETAKPMVQPQETSDSLLSNEALSEPDLLAGLAKIVQTPARKAEDRNEALSHLLNLTDEDHNAVLLALARDPGLGEPLARRLFEDAFNRSLGWQVDLGLVLLERQDLAPLHAAVREHLLFLLGPDMAADSDLKTLKQAGIAAKKQWAEQAAQ